MYPLQSQKAKVDLLIPATKARDVSYINSPEVLKKKALEELTKTITNAALKGETSVIWKIPKTINREQLYPILTEAGYTYSHKPREWDTLLISWKIS